MHRNTVHLVSGGDDALFLRPLLQPMLDRSFASGPYRGRMVAGHDRDDSSPPRGKRSPTVRWPRPRSVPPWPNAGRCPTG